MKFIQTINLPLVRNLYGVKWGNTNIYKIEFNIQFFSYIGPVLINGMPAPILLHPQAWHFSFVRMGGSWANNAIGCTIANKLIM